MTKNRLWFSVIALVAVVFLAGATAAKADELDHRTVFTINQPVRIDAAHVVLPAGSYVIKIVDPIFARNVVRITNLDETKVYATFFGTPEQFRVSVEKPRLEFGESARGSAQPLRAWYYAGDNRGIEFQAN